MAEFERETVYEKARDADVKAQNREDFMKRWFAIALSVGFATALSRMPWIEDERSFLISAPLDWGQINQIMRLFAAGVATLLSWEGYLLSIRGKPLWDGARFYIDVFLVTLYLILLLTSSSSQFWIGIHTFTFLIYILWDFLSIKVHPDQYILSNKEEYTSRRKIYAGVFKGSPDIKHGPIVTLTWPVYLVTLSITYYCFFDTAERSYPVVTILYFGLILFGLWGYRAAKQDETSGLSARILWVLGCSATAVTLAWGVRFIL